jgi:hypothetical protein
MFSGVFRLSENPQELWLRIHPIKRESYSSMLSDKVTVTQNGEELVITDVILVLNGSGGNVNISYKQLAGLSFNQDYSVVETSGFDNNGEPIIYTMSDGSLRVVFSSLPPNGDKSFDMDHFSNSFVKRIQAGAIHDDREVFFIPRPTDNTVGEILEFLSGYQAARLVQL